MASPLAAVFVVALLMMTAEWLLPGRVWPKVKGWWPRALLLNGAQIAAVFLAGVAWDRAFQKHQPWSLRALPPLAAGALGYVVHTFIYYWWHRARHASPFLWRWVHQVHHSPQRIEIITSFYKHPIEVLINSVLSSAILYALLGLSPAAGAITFTMNALAEFFYHWNVSTPHWLGYLIQRPESHCVHHQDGVHGFNYGDLPVFDALFGTLRNPPRWNGRCGLGEAEHQLGRLLAGREAQTAEPDR